MTMRPCLLTSYPSMPRGIPPHLCLTAVPARASSQRTCRSFGALYPLGCRQSLMGTFIYALSALTPGRHAGPCVCLDRQRAVNIARFSVFASGVRTPKHSHLHTLHRALPHFSTSMPYRRHLKRPTGSADYLDLPTMLSVVTSVAPHGSRGTHLNILPSFASIFEPLSET